MIARVIAIVAFLGTIALPLRAQSLDGIWKSEGYGQVYQIHGSKLQTFEVTTITCVVDGSATLENATFPGREVSFKADESHGPIPFGVAGP